ncbi:MAG: hypothetical protein R6T99_09135 [Bacteroidales bacterium]
MLDYLLAEYRKTREKSTAVSETEEVLNEEIVKIPTYDIGICRNKKFNNEISQELSIYRKLNTLLKYDLLT